MVDDEPDPSLFPFLQTDHAVAIANAIAAWARFEYEIDEFIWELACLEPEQGACLTAQFQTVATRFNAFIALARVQKITEQHVKRINSMRARSDALAEKRNRLVHDPWFYGYYTKENYRLQRTAKATLVHRYELVTAKEIEEIQGQIEKLLNDFRDVRTDVLHAFWSLP